MQNTEIKILFFGSTDFSLSSLISLYESEYKIVGVVTQSDKPSGRGKSISISPVKQWAIENNIIIFQPNKLKEQSDYSFVNELKPDLLVVASYGKILPLDLLNLPKFGAINVHASLLPKYRGASPIQAAILAGDSETGISIMRMDAGMDTGPILMQKSVVIEDNETAGLLSKKLAKLGADLLIESLCGWINGKIIPRNQQEELASICKKINKEDGIIDWKMESSAIERLIRAYNPRPSAWSTLKEGGQIIKIHLAKNIVADHDQTDIGRLFLTDKKNLGVYCNQKSALELLSVQPQGKGPMSGRDFILGRQKLLGTFLES
jgi:methionyl-tRNA formyltransferase